MAEFSPESCPVGITNAKNVEKLGDHFDMAIERLTEKVGELKEEVTSLSKNMDEKFDCVDKRFDSMEQKVQQEIKELKASIPSTVDSKIEERKGKTAAAAWKWILLGFAVPIVIGVITALIKAIFGI